MANYDMDRLLTPVWEGSTVYRESFMPVAPAGQEVRVPLLYKAETIVEVMDAQITIRYEEGKDYRLEDGVLVIPTDSAIKGMTMEEYYPAEYIEGNIFWKRGGGYQYFAEGNFFHQKQFVVTYTHSGSWGGPLPEASLAKLPRLKAKLEAGEPVKVLFYGDSITTGANSSGMTGIEPFQPDWCQMVMEGLKKRWPEVSFESVNTAVGGTLSQWGLEEAPTRAAAHKPDLAILAFGMNDGSLSVSKEAYQANMRGIMDVISAEKPDAEFILIATTIPNEETLLMRSRPRAEGEDPTCEDHRSFNNGRHDEFLPMLEALKGEHVALTDMTTMHHYLLSIKPFRDMTGNNVNHPNDFLARMYAQTVLGTLE